MSKDYEDPEDPVMDKGMKEGSVKEEKMDKLEQGPVIHRGNVRGVRSGAWHGFNKKK